MIGIQRGDCPKEPTRKELQASFISLLESAEYNLQLALDIDDNDQVGSILSDIQSMLKGLEDDQTS